MLQEKAAYKESVSYALDDVEEGLRTVIEGLGAQDSVLAPWQAARATFMSQLPSQLQLGVDGMDSPHLVSNLLKPLHLPPPQAGSAGGAPRQGLLGSQVL